MAKQPPREVSAREFQEMQWADALARDQIADLRVRDEVRGNIIPGKQPPARSGGN